MFKVSGPEADDLRLSATWQRCRDAASKLLWVYERQPVSFSSEVLDSNTSAFNWRSAETSCDHLELRRVVEKKEANSLTSI